MSASPLSPWRSAPAVLFIIVVTIVSSVAATERHFASLPSTRATVVRELAPTRGTIYDRSGRIILAKTEDLARLVADRSASEIEADRIAALVSRIADRPIEPLIASLVAPGGWRIVDRAPFSGERLSALRELESDGALSPARLETVVARSHLEGGIEGTSLASQLLGFVSSDGVGHYGIEGYYDDLLGGVAGSERIERDGSRTPIDALRQGSDLVLSIDAGLQRACEIIAGETHLADEALGVSIVLMDTATGELLASASSPAYDGSRPGSLGEDGWSDPVISRPFDPGSVMKPFSIIAALAAGVTSEDERMSDLRRLYMPDGSGSVRNWDGRTKGMISVAEGLILSRNVITSLLSFRLGSTIKAAAVTLFAQYAAFGFGSRSGVDLANESDGIVRNPSVSRWRAIDLANASFGQGISITPLAMTTAYASIANGGVLLRPRGVLAVDGRATEIVARGRSVDPALAARMRTVLADALEDPTYRTARTQLPDAWSGGGKTGTAEIYDPESREWLAGVYNFSMGGWIGRAEPEVAIFVTIWRARSVGALFYLPVSSRELWGRVAGEVAQRIDDGRLVLTGAPR